MAKGAVPIQRDERLCWSTIPVPRGKRLPGWIIGPLHGVETHFHNKKTRPCIYRYTRGELECPLCLTTRIRWTGYQPLLSEPELRKIVVKVSSQVYPILDSLPHGTPISVSQAEKGNFPVQVRQLSDTEYIAANRQRAMRRPPQDIDRYLISLWNMPELTNWFYAMLKEPVPDFTRFDDPGTNEEPVEG